MARPGRPVGTVPLWLALFAVLAALVLGGCAAQGKRRAAPKKTNFASADEKNVHAFMEKYPAIVMRGDVQAIRRLYTDDARIVPFLGGVIRPIRAGEMDSRLPEVVAEERRVGLRLTLREPMHIEVAGERAVVRVIATLAWKDKGKEQKANLNCYFGLIQDEHYIWRIREAHGEPVKAGSSLPAAKGGKKPLPPRDPKLGPHTRGTVRKIKGEPEKVEKPAPQQAQPAPKDTEQQDAPPQAPDVDKGPQPLF